MRGLRRVLAFRSTASNFPKPTRDTGLRAMMLSVMMFSAAFTAASASFGLNPVRTATAAESSV